MDDDGNGLGAMTPPEVWKSMAETPGSLLIDVRTQAEWAFVGTADTSAIDRAQCFIEWTTFPAMTPNQRFVAAVDEAIDKHDAKALFFLCRSGGRSHDAAATMARHLTARGAEMHCINVLEGFEGPVDPQGHRGAVGGWKAHGLPWRQS